MERTACEICKQPLCSDGERTVGVCVMCMPFAGAVKRIRPSARTRPSSPPAAAPRALTADDDAGRLMQDAVQTASRVWANDSGDAGSPSSSSMDASDTRDTDSGSSWGGGGDSGGGGASGDY